MSFSGTKGYITKPKPGVQINPLHPLSKGIVNYWLFNEGSGSQAYDISGYGNHGVLTNMSPNSQNSGWSGSKFGGGLKFDGGNDYVEIPSLNLFDGSQDWTISTWINADILDVSGSNFIWHPRADFDIFLRYEDRAGEDEFQLAWYDTEVHATTYASPSANKWYYLVGVWDVSASLLRFYVNGIQAGTVATGSPSSTSDKSTIGCQYVSGIGYIFWNGIIDSFCIYNRAISSVDVKQFYNDPFCNLMQVPIRRYSVAAIMNQFQTVNLGADLYNGAIIA